ncbi:MAG: Ig-like domain-containing protein [Bacteroidales bacterium]|nr:Ig-like domain-containing protein [Bacteroidales bacterium]
MTSKIKNSIFALGMITLIVFMTFSCAQIGSVTGGDKDTAAPNLKKSRPVIYSAEYDGKKVKIKFDEYYQLDNAETKFLMSPPHDSLKPKIKTKGKWLVVKFKEKLKDDTTYTLQFFDAIKDFNEGNKIENFNFVFSTGNVCDSFAVAGQILDGQTLECQKEMLVGLYGEQTDFLDSVPIKQKPDYITRTDTAGRFKIDNVIPGRYKVFAMTDINESQRFDLENEKIAFLKTIIETKAERVRKVDSLPAGTILHLGEKGHRILDTLLTDSVIVQDLLYTTPNNLLLFSFEEVHLIQYITDRSRDMRSRFKINFNKTVGQDSVIITYVDDTLKSPKMIYDFNKNRDSLIVWLTDTTDINNDTLEVRVSFPTLDSLNNPIVETDTLSVRFKNKKAGKGKKEEKQEDTGIDSLSFRLKTNFSGDFDINASVNIQVPIVYDKIDTSLLKLYEVVDSSFVDDMNNKIMKAARLDSANYRLIFKRPILGDIVFYPTDSIVRPDWYRAVYSKNRDTVDIEVLDSAMIRKSKFSNLLKYKNDYYLGQVQKIRDSVSTEIINQSIISYSRPSHDTIKILLEKVPTRGVEVSPINLEKFPEDGIQVLQDKDHITLLLRDTAAVNKDTLVLKFNTFDRMIINPRNQKLQERNLKDTLFAIYKIKFQRPKSQQLIGTDTMQFVFERKLQTSPSVSIVTFPEKGNSWYQSFINNNRDTFTIVTTDPDIAKLDTIPYALSYQTFDNKENIITKTDTLEFVRPKLDNKSNDKGGGRRRKSDVGLQNQKENEEAKKNMFTATLLFEKHYEITVDSMNSKNRVLTAEFEPEKQYQLMIDDSTFTSVYNTPNLYVLSSAKTRGLDYYGKITINLSNIGYIEHFPDIQEDLPPFAEIDTARTLRRKINARDTLPVQYTSIEQGQVLVCLCNNKGEIKYSKYVKADGPVDFDFILPADYKVILIHDINSNGKWDTGKYLNNQYPERVVEFPKPQTVKSKWQTQVDWKL